MNAELSAGIVSGNQSRRNSEYEYGIQGENEGWSRREAQGGHRTQSMRKTRSRRAGQSRQAIQNAGEKHEARAKSCGRGFARSAEKGSRVILQFGGVTAVYIVVLLCEELGAGDATTWLAFTASFTACVVAGIFAHELKSGR